MEALIITTQFALVLALACFVLTAPVVYADNPDYHVGASCDAASRRADIDADNVRPGAKDLTPDDLPDQRNNQKPKVVCDFGAGMQVGLTANVDENGGNSSILVWIDGVSVGGLNIFLPDGGHVAVSFPDNQTLHVSDCSGTIFGKPDEPCRDADYTTVYHPTSVSSPSFDCAKARMVVEILVCDDPQLAAADRAMADVYQRVRARPGDHAKLIEWQRGFMSLLPSGCLPAPRKFFPINVTSAKECLAKEYARHLKDLGQILRGELGENGERTQ